MAALIALPSAVLVAAAGWGGWRLAVRQANTAAEQQALDQFKWAVEMIGSNSSTDQVAGWVTMQTLSTSPHLSKANRRMIETTALRLRAITGGTP